MTTFAPPPRTPSPKVRIHRSQSFDSPSSRISVTPIDDSPYSKSASAIEICPPAISIYAPRKQTQLARLQQHCVLMNRGLGVGNTDEDSEISDAEMSDTSISSSEPSSPMGSERSSNNYGNAGASDGYELFGSASPSPSHSASHSPSSVRSDSTSHSPHLYPSSPQRQMQSQESHPTLETVLGEDLSVAQYQLPNTPMHDPWLVRMVLDMYDVRGFDWTAIAEPIQRCWGRRTCSAEVLGILCGNGRVGRVWWE